MITVVRAETPEPSARCEGTFTGEAWKDTILSRRDGIAMGNVFFAPKARTYWHAHEGGQILIVTAGEGFVGDDRGVVRVQAGDTIWTPPGVRHWHGAAADRYMIHTAISIAGVDWFDPVSDEDYSSGRADDLSIATSTRGR
ncbi:cupin domain-containing protein [Rhodococcus koreensis]|uniref:cupin domain-containing protein n=1 Tax=Rhodococcus koreensis TaxID=99653 RepID=UPI003671AB06